LHPEQSVQLRTIHAAPLFFCDETPMPVLDPGRGCTKVCQFWAHALDGVSPNEGPRGVSDVQIARKRELAIGDHAIDFQTPGTQSIARQIAHCPSAGRNCHLKEPYAHPVARLFIDGTREFARRLMKGKS
jgi:hypothetical protein